MLQPNTIYPLGSVDAIVLETNPQTTRLIQLPIAATPIVENIDTDRLSHAIDDHCAKTEQAKSRSTRLDDLVRISVLLKQAIRLNVETVIKQIRDNKGTWEFLTRDLDGNPYHAACFNGWEEASRAVKALRGKATLVGVSVKSAETLLPYLSASLTESLSKMPPVDIAVRIAEGRLLTLGDCRAMDIDIPAGWTGRCTVERVKTERGEVRYDVTCAARKTRGAEWVIDMDALADAVGLARLLEASRDQIMAALTDEGLQKVG